jgi:deoxyribodipyrimidine photolyase-related protein
MASKPYVATGKYIQRMSPHCQGCRYDPAQRSGERACPYTTLYWDFLLTHEASLARNLRMALQVKNVARLDEAQRDAIRARATAIREGAVGCQVSGTAGGSAGGTVGRPVSATSGDAPRQARLDV